MANEDNGVRIVDAKEVAGEKELETTLRPRCFDEYVGQDNIKKSLSIAMAAAKGRQEPLDHILLFGPPGLGKTTLAHIIAKSMGSHLRVTSGSAIERPGDLASIITNLNEGDVLFIDEIHRLGRQVEEVLYSAMEDYVIDVIVGKGPSARSLRLDLPKFTLIGATTKTGSLSSPLRDRFGATYRLDFYTPANISAILKRSARILNIELSDKYADIIAAVSRHTPRAANRILKRIRDFAEVKGNGQISSQIIDEALKLMSIDKSGLDNLDRKILDCIIKRFAGGPVGLSALSAAIAEEQQTIEEVYEPYLLQAGFINRTAQGRTATIKAYNLLGIKPISKKSKVKVSLPLI